jgi:ribonuclease HII
MPLDLETMRQHGAPIVGVDEVGMGPLAGPVCACALMMPPEAAATVSDEVAEVNDSKTLSEEKREHLFIRIVSVSTHHVGWVSVKEIESHKNIRESGTIARRRALQGLLGKCRHRDLVPPTAIISDWFNVILPGQSIPCIHPAKADGLSFLVACASIVAKVTRDRKMIELAETVDARYDWIHCKGYGTGRHRAAIQLLGLTPHHRVHMIKPPKEGWKGLTQ